ncbi:MAG: YceK/YidQ family lipoprotein [Limisphaerales bacterium]
MIGATLGLGCASYYTRRGGPTDGTYPGLRNNLEAAKDTGHVPAVLAYPALLIDTPLSAAFDTLALPFDLLKRKQSGSNRAAVTNSPPVLEKR